MEKSLDNYKFINGGKSEAESNKVNTGVLTLEEVEKIVDSLNSMIKNEQEKNRVLSKQIINLQKKISTLNDTINKMKTHDFLRELELKNNHNERGAGRKPFSNIEVVKEIYRLYSNGDILQNIADKLNRRNIKTARGGSWSKSSVRFILLNYEYVKKGVIDETTFHDVSSLMKYKKIRKNYKK